MIKAPAGGGPNFRPTGIPTLDPLPWGAHVCLFHETDADLVNAVAGFFAAGLAGNEYCLWIMPNAIERDTAVAALRSASERFDDRAASGAIDLIPERETLYAAQGRGFDTALKDFRAWLDRALARGFAGLRFTATAHWQARVLWPTFHDLEETLTDFMSGLPIMILSTYPLGEASAVDVANVVRLHQFSILLREGRWELLQTPWLAARRQQADRQPAIARFAAYDQLTPREREILLGLGTGGSNKAVARQLGISPRTVEFHRANIMRKLHARSFAELLAKVHAGA